MTNKLYHELIKRELSVYAPYAFYSKDTQGRYDRTRYKESYRLDFQRDRDKVLHSKFFRRLKGKTQVFLSPLGDHYRTRLMHTLEVAQIARTISRALSLNEDLTEAIALGHDLGHTPFGHMGERVLNELSSHGFHHAKQSKRIAEFMNLSIEVIEGILKHTKGKGPILSDIQKGLSLEAQVVRVSDIIAYINHDFDDAVRAKLLSESELPVEISSILGSTRKERLGKMIDAVIFDSLDFYKNHGYLERLYIRDEILNALSNFRNFMFSRVYEAKVLMDDYPKVKRLISGLFNYYMDNVDAFEPLLDNIADKEQRVIDYISGMTDNFAIRQYNSIFLPRQWDEHTE